MEPIRESSRERRIERALLVIEGLTYLHDDLVRKPDVELADGTIVHGGYEEKGFSSQAYRIAHAALGHCSAHDLEKHDGCNAWLEEIEEAEKALKELNIMDVEKILSPS